MAAPKAPTVEEAKAWLEQTAPAIAANKADAETADKYSKWLNYVQTYDYRYQDPLIGQTKQIAKTQAGEEQADQAEKEQPRHKTDPVREQLKAHLVLAAPAIHMLKPEYQRAFAHHVEAIRQTEPGFLKPHPLVDKSFQAPAAPQPVTKSISEQAKAQVQQLMENIEKFKGSQRPPAARGPEDKTKADMPAWMGREDKSGA